MTAANSGVSDHGSGSSSWNREIPFSSSGSNGYLQCSMQTTLSGAAASLRPAAPGPVSRAAGVATAAGRSTADPAADVSVPPSAATASSRVPTAASRTSSPFLSALFDASVASAPAKTASTEGRGATAAAPAGPSSPLLPAAGFPPPAAWFSRPTSAAAASTAATTPAAAATPSVGAAGSRTRLLREEQHAAAASASVVTPPAAEAAFFLHSADVVLVSKSFGHPLPSPRLSVPWLADAASSPFSTPSSPGALPPALATPRYFQLTGTAPCSRSPAAATCPSSSEGVFSLICTILRWLLLQLVLLLSCLYGPSFYPLSSFSSSSYLESAVLRASGWCSARLCALISFCLRLFFLVPRLLRLISGGSPLPQQSAALQGALATGICSTDVVSCAAAPALQTFATCSTSLASSDASFFYLIADGACSDPAKQVDGGGALLLTQLPLAVAASGVAGWNHPTVSRSSPRYLTSSSAVLYGHSPATVILRNVGKTSSVEAAFGVSAYPPPTADFTASATGKCTAAVTLAAGGEAPAAATPPQPGASWLKLLWQRLQQPRKTTTVCPCRYPIAAVVLCPPASTSLLLVGYSDGRLETLQPSSAVAALNSSSSNNGRNSYGLNDSSDSGTGCSSRFYGGVKKSVWFAGTELLNDASVLAESSGDGLSSPPAEAAAAGGTGMQPGLTAAGGGDNFPLWQLVGVERLHGPVLSLRASPCNTRICALTSHSVYIFEIPEDQQQETEEPASSCYSSSSSREASGGSSARDDDPRRRWFYRTTRFSSLFAFGKEALYCCCTPLACCWTNSRQLLLLCSNGKLSVFCRDPRRAVGEWRCVTRLQLDAAARKSLRSAMQTDSRSSSRSSSRSARFCDGRGTEQLSTSNSRSEESIKRGDMSRKSRDLASSRRGETTAGRYASEGCSRKAVGKRDVELQRHTETHKERQPRTATPLRHSDGDQMLFSPSPLFSSPATSAGEWESTLLGETTTAAVEEAWRGSFPVAMLDYSASLQTLYVSIRDHAVLLVIPWKALYACGYFPTSSSFFHVSLSSPCCTAAAALPRLSSRGWRRGAGGLLSSLGSRLLHRNEQVLAPLYEIDFRLPVWMQMQRFERWKQQQQTHLLGRQAQRQRQQISGYTAQQFSPGAAASTSQHEFTEQQQRNAARREGGAAAANTREPNEEAVGGAAWIDVDNATKSRTTLDIQAEKKQLLEQQQRLGSTRPLQTSDVGGILSFALTTEAAGASYMAVLHAGCSSVFVYDANFLNAGDVLLPDSISNDVSAFVRQEEQQQVRAPVMRFCVPPPWAGCRPVALAFLSSPHKKTRSTFFSTPSPAAAVAYAAADAGILLGVRWVYPGVSRTEEGEVKQAMLPAFTAFYSLPSVAAADARQQIDSSWLRTPSAAHACGLLATAVPPLSPLLSASLPPASATSCPVGVGVSSASSAAAAFSARMAAAEQETLDAWRAAARLAVPPDSATVNVATAGAAGACRGSSSNVCGNSSFTQRNACTGRVGCSSSADFRSARGSNPLDACGDSNNSSARGSRTACYPSCDSMPLGAYKEEFFTPASPGISSGEIGSQRWRTEANAQSESVLRATATRVVPLSTGIGEVSGGVAAAEGNLPSSRLSAWNSASPVLVDSTRFNAGRGTAAFMQQGDMVNSSVLPLGRSSSRAGGCGYYDIPKKEKVLEGRDAPAADVWLTQEDTGWLQRWQLHQQTLMQRWQLPQPQKQRMDQQALQSLSQSDLEIPPPPPSSFSRWTPSYPRVTVQRPAPYSFFHPYSSTGLSRLCGLQRNSCYDAMPHQRQRLSQQQQQLSFMCRTHAVESGELYDASRWPFLSPESPGLFSSAVGNCSFPETVAGGASASLAAQGNPLQQAFVDTRNCTTRQTLSNDDFSIPAYRPVLDHSVNVSALQHESPPTNARSTSSRQQQQLGCTTSVPVQNCAGLLTANKANNVLQETLPAPRSPAPVAAGTSNLYELGLSKGTDVGGAAGQDYMDACYSLQRNPLGASALRLSNASLHQPFTNSRWTAKFVSGPRISVL